MPKRGEIHLPDFMGESGRDHALHKPFSDGACGRYLRDLGSVFQLLPPPPARLLDLGVGPGWTSLMFGRRGYDVVAQDISPGMIEMARRNQSLQQIARVEFRVQDYEEMAYDAEFDCAVFFDSLHHAEDELAALRGVYRALRPGGVCVTAEPERGHGDAPAAREYAERYGVTEKDMHPGRIIEIGRAVGFGSFEIFERSTEPRRLFTGTSEKVAAPSRLELGFGYLGRGLRCLIAGPKQRDAAALGFTPATTFVHNNFVRLRK